MRRSHLRHPARRKPVAPIRCSTIRNSVHRPSARRRGRRRRELYGQASGKTAFVNLHVAPGLGNAIGMIYGALKNNTPMVVTAAADTRFACAIRYWATTSPRWPHPSPMERAGRECR